MKFWFNQKKEKAHDKFGHFSPDYVAELFLYCQRESLDEGVYSNIKEYLKHELGRVVIVADSFLLGRNRPEVIRNARNRVNDCIDCKAGYEGFTEKMQKVVDIMYLDKVIDTTLKDSLLDRKDFLNIKAD